MHRFLAIGYDKLGRQQERFGHLERALVLLEPVHGETHPEIAQLCTQISWCAQMNERHREGLPFAEQAVRIYEALNDNSLRSAQALNALSNCLSVIERHEEAEEIGHQALALVSSDEYEDSLGLAQLQWIQAGVARRAGKFEHALRLSANVLRIRRLHFPEENHEEHHEVAAARYSLAQNLFRIGELDKAQREFEAALQVLDRVYTYYTFQVGTARYEYFELLRRRDKYEQIFKYFGNEHPQQKRDLMLDYMVVAAYLDIGDYPSAIDILQNKRHLSGDLDVGKLPPHSLHFLRVYFAYWSGNRCSHQIERELCQRANVISANHASPLKRAMQAWTSLLSADSTITRLQLAEIRDQISLEAQLSVRGFALLLIAECYEDVGERPAAFRTAKRALHTTPETDVFVRHQILQCLARTQTIEDRLEIRNLISDELTNLKNRSDVFAPMHGKLEHLRASLIGRRK